MTSFKIHSLFENNKDNSTTYTGTLTGILHFQCDTSALMWCRSEHGLQKNKQKKRHQTPGFVQYNQKSNHEWPLIDYESTMLIYSPESLLTKITPSLQLVS